VSDAYEEKFMSDGAEVLLRDKTVWRAGVAMLGIPTLVTLGASALAAWGLATHTAEASAWLGLVIPLGVASITGTCTALFAVLRCTVTTEHLSVQFGVLGPSIPIDAITSIEVAPYLFSHWGGWGVRGLGRNVAYSTTGPGRGVQIVYLKDGVPHRVFVTSYDPESIVRAVQEAKARRARPAATRVAAELGDADEEDESDERAERRASRARR
jgi:hypothetical protein